MKEKCEMIREEECEEAKWIVEIHTAGHPNNEIWKHKYKVCNACKNNFKWDKVRKLV